MSSQQVYFTAHRSELLRALTAANEAVASKDTIPILRNILMKPDGERLVVRGTDLDIEIETTCDLIATSTSEGLTVAGDELFKIVKNMPESAEISFAPSKSAGQVAISGARSKYNLNTLPEKDFPSMGSTVPEFAFSISATILAEAFGKVLFAVNTSIPQRAHLMGAFIELQDSGKLAVVGCDGLKIAVARVTPVEATGFEAPIIPTKTVKAFQKLLGDRKSLCSVRVDENKIIVECEDLRIVSKLVDGTYVPFERVIPAKADSYVRADRSATAKAITRARAISSDAAREAIKLSVSSDGMQIELVTTDGQSAVEFVDIEYDGESYVKGFNGSFVNEMLNSISTTSFRMFGADPVAPGHFSPDSDADEDYIVMPIRV